MGKMCEGNRVKTFVADAVLLAADLNDIQDQGIAGLEARTIPLLSLFQTDPTATYECGWIADYQPTGAPGWYTITTGTPAGERMHAILPLRVGEKITAIDLIYQDTGVAGGEMALYKAPMPTAGTGGAVASLTAPTKVADVGYSSNPWDVTPITAGHWYHHSEALSVTVEEGYIYFVSIQATSSGNPCNLAGATVTAQFTA